MQKKILWIDDEIEYFRSHIDFLESYGYSVVAASTGDEAVKLIRESAASTYAIVLLDKQMPIKNGNATLDEIKAIYPELPVVMLSGECLRGSNAAGKKKYDGCLLKPIDVNQLLLVCKQIIDSRQCTSSKFTDLYFRSYAENRARMNGILSASDHVDLYTELTKWDIEIDNAIGCSEEVRQMHAGLKFDVGKAFGEVVVENYASWVTAGRDRPNMAVDVVEKVVVPELQQGRSVLLMALSGMRLDQFLAIEPDINVFFSISKTAFMSVLPTIFDFCATALVSGLYPSAMAAIEPRLFTAPNAPLDPIAVKRLMRVGLERAGAEKVKVFFANAGGVNKRVKAAIDAMKKAQTFGVVALNAFSGILSGKRVREAAIDETAFRRRTQKWFADSAILHTLREACDGSCTVILTSDHGNILCRRVGEIYETAQIDGTPRCVFGPRMSVDEREALLLDNLSHFMLPPFTVDTKCAIARENYYFALPAGGRKRRAVADFQCGGISPEEMIMPLYICR